MRLAEELGVSPLLIGLAVVGFGTSTPELVTRVQAALVGSPGIAVGTIVGSNLFNILVILGLAALVWPIAVSSTALRRDGVLVIATALLLTLIGWFWMLDRALAGVLLALLAGCIAYAWLQERLAGSGHTAAFEKAVAFESADPALRPGGEAPTGRGAAGWVAPLLLNGVTGIRDMGGLLPVEEQRRIAAKVEVGTRRDPRVIPSGAWVDAPPGSWPGMYLAATPEEERQAVREIAEQGRPAVKSYSMLAPDTYRALAAEAIGLPLVGHVPESVMLGEAIATGQDGIEHWGHVTMTCSTTEAELVASVEAALQSPDPRSALITAMQGQNAPVLETWDEAPCRDTVTAKAAAGLAVSPTLVVADFRLEAMTDEIRALADASYANPPLFHGSLPDELDRYVAIGLSPQEALYTATVAPPMFLRLPDQDGTLAPGRRADIVLLDANPIWGLGTLREPVAGNAKGRLLDREALDAVVADLQKRGS